MKVFESFIVLELNKIDIENEHIPISNIIFYFVFESNKIHIENKNI